MFQHKASKGSGGMSPRIYFRLLLVHLQIPDHEKYHMLLWCILRCSSTCQNTHVMHFIQYSSLSETSNLNFCLKFRGVRQEYIKGISIALNETLQVL